MGNLKIWGDYHMADIDKVTRVLRLYQRLYSGKKIHKAQYCIENGIGERTFDRDIEDIRLFLSENYSAQELCYSREDNSYAMTKTFGRKLSGEEAVILGNLLLSVKDFQVDEMEGMIEGLIAATEPARQNTIKKLFVDQAGLYRRSQRNKALMKMEWDIMAAILNRKKIRLNYEMGSGEKVIRDILPVDIIYNDGFGYLIAYKAEMKYKYPAFFKLNRILSFKLTGGTYSERLKNDYTKLELRNYLKYMQGGELQNITLKCKNDKRKVVEDSFRVIKIIEEKEGEYILEIQCFSQGFFQWILGQESGVEVLKPQVLRKKLKATYEKMMNVYREDESNG